MQKYYRTAKTVTQINAIVLQNIGAALFPPPEEPPQRINERFQNAHEFLDVVHEDVFKQTPGAILEAFLLLQKHAELKGMSARTQRALWRARKLIDDDFRSNLDNRALFLQIFKQERASGPGVPAHEPTGCPRSLSAQFRTHRRADAA
jgi:[protein-PII] uridylyltransferase